MNRKVDYDFIGFTYNGYHSIDDLKIYRTSDGDRYNINISPERADKTADFPDGDGTYFFSSRYVKKQFSVNFAFDDLSEAEIRKISEVFAHTGIHELIFDEYPYKAYDAFIAQPVELNYICFDGENGKRVYKGNGTISFVCPKPFAHTPYKTNQVVIKNNCRVDFSIDKEVVAGKYVIKNKSNAAPRAVSIDTFEKENYWFSNFSNNQTISLCFSQSTTITKIRVFYEGELDEITNVEVNLSLSEDDYEIPLINSEYSGMDLDSYNDYNKDLWEEVSDLPRENFCMGENYGDIEAPFILTYQGEIKDQLTFTVGDKSITIHGKNECYYTDLEWRSETGLVLAKTVSSEKESEKAPIYFTGQSVAAIPVGGLALNEIFAIDTKGQKTEFNINSPIKLSYNYWYY